jgi:hypothetical protein
MKPHTTANEFAPANTQTAHAAVNTATTRPATFAKRFALPGLAALSLLATGVLAAIETQKETTLSTASEAMAGDACFKVEAKRYEDYLQLVGQERDAWTPYVCKQRIEGSPCSETKDIRYKVCPKRPISRCVDGKKFKDCQTITESCPSGPEAVACFYSLVPPGIWYLDDNRDHGPAIDDCTSSHSRAIGSGKCEKDEK